MEGPDRRVHQWPLVSGGVDLPTSEVRSTQELTIVGGVSVILSIHYYLLARPHKKSAKNQFCCLEDVVAVRKRELT